MKINGFISHRCKEYHFDNIREPFESYLFRKGINPLFGCELESNIMGILEENIRNNIERSDIFIAFITRSWIFDSLTKQRYPSKWPMREWKIWNEIKKDTPFLSCCIGFSLYPYKLPEKRKRDFHPLYTSEIMTFSLSLENDGYYNFVFSKEENNSLYVNEVDHQRIEELIEKYIQIR